MVTTALMVCFIIPYHLLIVVVNNSNNNSSRVALLSFGSFVRRIEDLYYILVAEKGYV